MLDCFINSLGADSALSGTNGARFVIAGILLGMLAPGSAFAQASGPGAAGSTSVSWVAGPPTTSVKRGGRVALVLNATVRDGWHVYALNQLPNGPTPLQVALDPNALATADGQPSGSPPVTALDPAFNLVTPYYTRAFTVTVPVRLKAKLASGVQAVPITVRFQTCNGQICQPPKAVHLFAPIDVKAR